MCKCITHDAAVHFQQEQPNTRIPQTYPDGFAEY